MSRVKGFDHPIGKLTVISRAENDSKGRARWLCQCECGNTTTVPGYDLRSGHVKSCGCSRVEVSQAKAFRHGKTGTRTFNVWNQMRQRCHSPGHPHFADYGGRGISVCERWRDSFADFLADMGEAPDAMTLERQENNGNYEPSNCVWATRTAQARNRRSSRQVTIDGITTCVAGWADISGTPATKIINRLNAGWEPKEAIFGRKVADVPKPKETM